MTTRIKICCIKSAAEARMAIDAGAWALGLVSWMPSGQGPIGDDQIAEIMAGITDPVETFLLTCRRDAASIIEQHNVCGTTTLQLVDHVPHEELALLRQALPGVRIVQVIHVGGESSIEEAAAVAPLVDMLLLDSGNPGLAVKELGGTGRTHNWDISTEIVRRIQAPVFLAGGLGPENVSQAIRKVMPFGVDLCSGIRSGGDLDAIRLDRFVKAVNQPLS